MLVDHSIVASIHQKHCLTLDAMLVGMSTMLMITS